MIAAPNMNEEMGKAFCREFWRMMETENNAKRICELLREDVKKLTNELASLHKEATMLRNLRRFCVENHEQ